MSLGCTGCGAEVARGDSYCRSCGARLANDLGSEPGTRGSGLGWVAAVLVVGAVVGWWLFAAEDTAQTSVQDGGLSPADAIASLGYLVYVEPAPDANARAAVLEGIRAWNRDDVQLVAGPQEATVLVQFVKEWGGHPAGQATLGGPSMQVGYGDSDCNGKWTPYSFRTVRSVAAHEFGHVLGVEDSSDPSDVMYPATDIRYGMPCEISTGVAEIPDANGTWTSRFALPWQARVAYDVHERDSGSVDVCIQNDGTDRACHDDVERASDDALVDEGETVVWVRCQNRVERCVFDYTIAYSR